MPKSYITRQEKLNNELTAWIYGQLKAKGIPQREISKELGISTQAFNYKLKTHTFRFEDLVVTFRILRPDAKTIARLMGEEEWRE